MEAMLANLNALEDCSRDPSLVTSFHTMQQVPMDFKVETQKEVKVFPWRLQLNPREDDPWNLLVQLQGNAVWNLIGLRYKQATMKQSAGSAGGIQPEGPSVSFLEKGDLLVMMTQMKLRNAANYCYCNATFFCLWWTILSRHAYSSGDWGASQDAVQNFFSCLDDQPRSIAECFGVLFEIWAHDTSPADAAEFAQSVLRWMNSPCLPRKWGRFFTIENVRQLHDEGDLHTPLFLQVPSCAVTSTSLQDLINRWNHEYGMETALFAAPEILVCHVDRTDNSNGTHVKLDFWLHADLPCTVPSFTSEGQQVPHDYVPVAVLAHLGDLTGGHYRAALPLTVGDDADAIHTHNTLWALTDDNAVPQVHPLPGLPEWICRNATLIFLLKKSQVDLFRNCRTLTLIGSDSKPCAVRWPSTAPPRPPSILRRNCLLEPGHHQ